MRLTVSNKGNLTSIITLDTSKYFLTISNKNQTVTIPHSEYKKLVEAISVLSRKESVSFVLANHQCKLQRVSNSINTIVLTVLIDANNIEIFEIDYLILVGNTTLDPELTVNGFLINQDENEIQNIHAVLERIIQKGAFPNLTFKLNP